MFAKTGDKALSIDEYIKIIRCIHESPFSLWCDERKCFEAEGLSSRFIEAHMKNMKVFDLRVFEPVDAEDFSKNYVLLKNHPEWIGRLQELQSKSTYWRLLIDNWTILERLYELQDLHQLTRYMKDLRNDNTKR
ncbi:MAG: hypothetical protein Sylvanvirus10_3 [Sylvanvirus sp.]|uniref:Uncharacterized protein n=1 Tax=Sylvanvirus sp. TaxID=2487774 RepID=A0A3G5AI15_9VIRU|nr:MAG: hypothetical protein Sylvanvirus10_3 [Sylvanvirus sp.]